MTPQVLALPQGLQEAVEVIDFVFTTVETLQEAKADGGGINYGDLPKVFALIQPAKLAVEGIETVPAAWKNASDEDKAVVYEHFANRFDLPNDELEAKIEKAVRAGYLLLDLVIG